MMSCGTSNRYGSSLLLKTTDFSIQTLRDARNAPSPGGERALVSLIQPSLLCRLFERTQHRIAARDRRIQRFLGSLLAGKCGFQFFGPEVAHLHHVAEAKPAR